MRTDPALDVARHPVNIASSGSSIIFPKARSRRADRRACGLDAGTDPQLTNEGRGIQVFCDEQGLATLIGALEKLRSTRGHMHLCTPANGRDLREKNPWGSDAIGEVIFTYGSSE
jgi:hypothetical protein